jgi:hypothetical protein
VLVGALAGRRGLVRIALGEAARVPAARAVLRDAYGMLAALLSAQLAKQVEMELDDAALAHSLRATARTMLPALARRR